MIDRLYMSPLRTSKSNGRWRKYLENLPNRAINILAKGALALSFTLVVQTTAEAHRPHDVVTQIETSHNYKTNQTVFILVRGNLFRSADGGNSWQRLVSGLDIESVESLSGLAIASKGKTSQDEIFLTSNHEGIFRSQDTGNSWTKFNTGLKSSEIQHIEAAPGTDRLVLASDFQGQVYQLSANDESWEIVLTIPDGEIVAIDISVITEPFNVVSTKDGRLWIAKGKTNNWIQKSVQGELNPEEFLNTVEVFNDKSGCDEGQSWKALGNVLDGAIVDLEIANLAQTKMPSVLASTNKQGLFILTESGHWQAQQSGLKTDPQAKEMKEPNFGKLEISADGQTFFIAGFDGLFRSQNQGQSWDSLETLARNTIVSLALSPNYVNDSTLAVASYVGLLYISQDGGKTWKITNRGLEIPRFTRKFDVVEPNYDPRRFFDIQFSPTYSRDQTIIASTLWSKLARTDNAGHSWTLLSIPKEIRGLTLALSPDYENDQTFFVSSQDKKIYSSENGGQDFTVVGERPPFKGNYGSSLVLSPNFKTDQTLFTSGEFGIYKSQDSGKTWEAITRNTPIETLGDLQIAVSPDYVRDRTLLVGSNAGLFQSTDAGTTWKKLSPLEDDETLYIEAVAFSPAYAQDQTAIISVRGYGLLKTTNSGTSFQSIGDSKILMSRMWNVPSSGRAIVFSPSYTTDNTLYGFGSAEHQIYRSQDGGETWNTINIPQLIESSPTFLESLQISLFVYSGLVKKAILAILLLILGSSAYLILKLKFSKQINSTTHEN
ncbi:MAG: hypothetical protein EAZ61_13015 [Oscillatoriales cyanobacterium]|nr:MAG: hypothetical protein EAZ61_13015 [Oscillatoriales cyanobacterium]